MLSLVLKIVVLSILLTKPTSSVNHLARHKGMIQKETRHPQRLSVNKSDPIARYERNTPSHHRRLKRSYMDVYDRSRTGYDNGEVIGDGWGGGGETKSNNPPQSQPVAQSYQVQDVFLQSVNNPPQQQLNGHYQQQPYAPAPQAPMNQPGIQGQPGYGQVPQQQHQNLGTAGFNQGQGQGHQQLQAFQGAPIGPPDPYQQGYNNEPSNNNAWSNQGQDSYHFDSNHQGKDPDYNGFDTGSHDGSSYQEWKSGHGGQYDLTPEPEYYKDSRWSEHLPNQGDRSHDQTHWLRGDPNAKSPGYKPTLPPVLVGRKTYWDFKDEDARDLERVFENAEERAKNNPHSYAPVPHGKLMNPARRREQYNYNVLNYRRREDMEKSGDLAYVPKNHYVKPLRYVDKNFKFMDINPSKPKWGSKKSQSEQNNKKKVEDDPTPFIDWARFGSNSTTLVPSGYSIILSLLISELLLYFILK